MAFAQIGVVGLDGQIELEALRLYGLPEAAPALLCGTPTLPVGQREFAARDRCSTCRRSGRAAPCTWSTSTVPGARQGDRAEASLASSTRFIELDAAAWSNNTVRVLARNVSGGAFDLGAADAVGGGHQAADPIDAGPMVSCAAYPTCVVMGDRSRAVEPEPHAAPRPLLP